MLRTGLLGRLCGLAGRNMPVQNWRGLGTTKRFFSSTPEDEDSPGEPEIIEDDPEAAQKFVKSKPAEYQFYKKNIAIVIENPLFPYSNTVVHLGKYQAKLLGQKMPSFVTCILRKELESSLEMSIDEDRKNQSLVGRDSTKEFVGVGTYCSVEFNKEYPSKIRLQGIHKVEVKSVAEYVMNMEAGADNQNLSDIVDELGQDEQETTVPATPKDPSKYMEQFVRQSIKAMRNQRSNKNSLQMEDSKFYITEVERLYNQRVQLEMEDRVKLEHMIDLSKKIMTIQGMPFMQETPLNFSDIELYLDLYGSFLARSQFFSREEMIEAFQERNVVERLNVVHSLMKKYYMMMGNYSYVGQEAQKNINNRQTRAFYNEVFDVVKTLSEGGQKGQKLITKLKETLSSKKPPVHVVEIFNEQIKRLSGANHESSDVNSVKAYLEWLVSMPYGIKSQDNLDIKNVKDKLNQEHFGLDEVKDRILQFVAVGKLKNTIKDKILLLHGPPGVGKTSLAESIARALGRQSERISLGGESDSTVLKGHRRTYMGSYPGKIVSALKKCGTENCVIILDEIDKLGRSNYHGDPQSNLLEILDPSQNKAFVDNYMDFPIDLSNVLFICTANSLGTISAPLLDRMDVISLSSYTGVEKKQILENHLLPRAIHDCGLEESKELFSIAPEVEDILINDYCREPGVRSLERHAKKIMDKIAYEIVVRREQNPDAVPSPIHVTKENLNDFVGNSIFDQEKLYSEPEPGVVIGLAYTQYGGAILFLEAKKYTFSRNTTSPGIKITGSLGDVMSESMKLAYTYARNHLHKLGNNFLETNDVHIHAPEGATPKDGPSAGITIASALVSLATNTPIKAGVGMTGELSLNGRVMKIGGVKEKTLAGKREGLKELIFPKDNEEDVKELKDYIKQGLTFHFVSTFEEAKPILFPNQANK